MKIWTVSNQKGGVGKTTTVVSLAGHLSSQGKRVLCVDLDPHGSLTCYFRLDPDVVDKGAYNLFYNSSKNREEDPKKYIHATQFDGLSIMPAATALATLDRKANQFEGLGLVITNALEQIKASYDYVLIDSPPMLGVLMINALAACQHLLIPVQTEFLALKGLERMIKTLQMIQKSRQKSLQYTIVPTMFDKRTRASVSSLNSLQNKFSHHLWDSYIPVDTQLREASRLGAPVSILAPKSKASVAYKGLLEALGEPKAKLALVSQK